MSQNPPKWADRFLAWYCNPDLLEDLQGDLYEVYYQHLDQDKPTKAKWLFIWLVLRSFRPSVFRRTEHHNNSFLAMTRNNIKIALRVLWMDRTNSAINLLGLTIGISCFLLLGLYVKQELSYDDFHTQKDRIYRMWLKEDYGEGKIFFNSNTPLRFERLMEDNFPEVARAVHYIEESFLVGRGESRIDERVAVISPDFFEVFDFPIGKGSASNPLPSRSDMAVSTSYANKYFGDTDPIGQTLGVEVLGEIRGFNISAVFQDIPTESSIQFDMAISTENGGDLYGDRMYQAWFSIIPETYVLLKDQATIATVESKMQDVVLSQMGDANDGPMPRDQYNIGFQPLTDIHLNPAIPLGFAPVSNPQYVFILGAIGLLVLVIACINYTTLAAGQSLKRAKEVGVRKVLGAARSTLVYQYLTESIVLALMAMLIGILITLALIPTFNVLTGSELLYSFDWSHFAIFLSAGLVIGLVAGAYPALVISGFNVIGILKGNKSAPGGLNVRRALVVLQFVITVFLISTALIMRDQIQYLMTKDLGYNYATVVTAELPRDSEADRLSTIISSGMDNGELIKAKLEAYPEISNVAMGSHLLGSNGWANLAYTDPNEVFRRFRLLVVDANYLDAFDIPIVAGRRFEDGNGLDQRQSILLNETAVSYFGFDDPIGKKLPGNSFGEHIIIGVVKDFNYSSLHSEIEPLVITQNIIPIVQGVSDYDFKDSYSPKLVFTYSGSQLTDATEILEREWEATFPNEALEYEFLDQRIRSQYENEARMNKLISVATVLSIVIASLGLLGLIMLVVASKLKEISIRKVMGASPFTILFVLSRGFMVQLLIAIALSVPLTLWFADSWLENFAYQTQIGPGLFVISGLLAIIVSAIVIGYHAWRATRVNPIKSLRME
ncbi:MAG: ABC transporter permease [Cyclobacteriaceae bacterium]